MQFSNYNNLITQSSIKKKNTTVLLALFLGTFGIHRFYLNQYIRGVLYLIFFWTYIPTFISLIDMLGFALMSDKKFNFKYNSKYVFNESVQTFTTSSYQQDNLMKNSKGSNSKFSFEYYNLLKDFHYTLSELIQKMIFNEGINNFVKNQKGVSTQEFVKTGVILDMVKIYKIISDNDIKMGSLEITGLMLSIYSFFPEGQNLFENDYETIVISYENRFFDEILEGLLQIESEDAEKSFGNSLNGGISFPLFLKESKNPLFEEFATVLYRFSVIISKADHVVTKKEEVLLKQIYQYTHNPNLGYNNESLNDDKSESSDSYFNEFNSLLSKAASLGDIFDKVAASIDLNEEEKSILRELSTTSDLDESEKELLDSILNSPTAPIDLNNKNNESLKTDFSTLDQLCESVDFNEDQKKALKEFSSKANLNKNEKRLVDNILNNKVLSIDSTENKTEEINVDKTDSLESILDELNSLIGLDDVKAEIESLINFIKIQKEREKSGLKSSSLSYHLVFTGNPGTGKTTVARIVARIYKHLGILKEGQLIETDRSGLVGEYTGQTAIKTNKTVNSALNGVLFVDEAYSLVGENKDDYGKEAVATLIKRMEDDRDKLVLIIAGYTNEMKSFIDTNPGFQSRFNRYIEFPDYSAEDLLRIFKSKCEKLDYKLTETAELKLREKFEDAYSNRNKSFGNGRYARNIFEKTLEKQANRISKESNITKEILITIEEYDIV